MSLLNHQILKQKKFIYPKEPLKKVKTFDNSSKSTRATSKNILALKNQKLYEKVEYFDLYSDLLSSRQEENVNFQKRYPKEDNEDSPNNSSTEIEKYSFKKHKKIYSQKKAKIELVKYFKEDGKPVNFPLFKEKLINIDEYDNKVKIESAEDDFESDESTLDYGRKKVEEDLMAAFSIIKKDNINCLVNYKKYFKIIKKPKKKLNLAKNLPKIPDIEK
jgi:hypothetical protein